MIRLFEFPPGVQGALQQAMLIPLEQELQEAEQITLDTLLRAAASREQALRLAAPVRDGLYRLLCPPRVEPRVAEGVQRQLHSPLQRWQSRGWALRFLIDPATARVSYVARKRIGEELKDIRRELCRM